MRKAAGLEAASALGKGYETEGVNVPAHARNPPLFSRSSPPISPMNGPPTVPAKTR